MAKQYTAPEQSTIIYPLPAARLYIDAMGEYTGRVETSFVNGIKASFSAHLLKGEAYTNVTATLYLIDILMKFEEIRQFLAADKPQNGVYTQVNFSTGLNTNYDNVRKEMSIQFMRNTQGIWSMGLTVTGKPHVIVSFNGLKNSVSGGPAEPYTSAMTSLAHFGTWLGLVNRTSEVAMVFEGYDTKKVLPPRGSTEEVTG